jgi:hypothetical protein
VFRFQVFATIGGRSVSPNYPNIDMFNLPACPGSKTSFGQQQGMQGPVQTVGGPAQTAQRPAHNVPTPLGGLRGVFLRLLKMQK